MKRWLANRPLRLGLLLCCLLLVAIMVRGRGVLAMGFGTQPARLVVYGDAISGAPGPVLFDDRTYVPIKALESVLKLTLDFDQPSQTLLVNSPRPAQLPGVPAPYKDYQVVNLIINGDPVQATPPAIYYQDSVYLPLRVLGELGLQVGWDQRSETAYVGSLGAELPVVGSVNNLEKLLATQNSGTRFTVNGVAVREQATTSAPVPAPTGAPPAADGSKAATPAAPTTVNGSVEFSTTNVQVEGIDEADIVKTDGQYLYQVRNNTVTITRAYPVAEMKQVKTLSFVDQSFRPVDLYVDGHHMVVIGQSNNNKFHDAMPEEIKKRGIDEKPTISNGPMIAMPMPPIYWGGNSTVKAIVYDLTNKEEPSLVREVELEGNLLTSRKVDNRIVLLTNKALYSPRPLPPYVHDTVQGDTFTEISLDQVHYFPDGVYSSYLLIAAFDLDAIDKGSVTEAYLGAGNSVYMSDQNLYVALPRGSETVVHRFAVNGTDIQHQAKGTVPGNILNQFSMDEYKGYFRVATTSWVSGSKGGQSSNNIYVLDAGMKTVGKLEDIAPGERIYSARFMGEKGYLVTFEQVDPLFVLDLSQPAEPKILGALKIPGFSNYLHPLDDNHLLGIGRDTEVIANKDAQGNPIGKSFAIQKGIKLAIFDVHDVNHPIEMFSQIIGGRGTEAEALNNHKAILFDARNNLLAFSVRETSPTADPMVYGPFAFQGAVVYNVSLDKGFTLKGEVTHLTDQDVLKAGQYWYGNDAEVRRVLYIGDDLYMVSNRSISAHDINTVTQVNKVNLQ